MAKSETTTEASKKDLDAELRLLIEVYQNNKFFDERLLEVHTQAPDFSTPTPCVITNDSTGG